ncbi:hypothetical protein QL285_015372 [Trifolium repens]|nr:hypothetical protein QL285_015372 [Trifolium repens]
MARTKTAARKNASQISQTPSPPSSPHPSPNNQPRPSKSPEKASETSQSPKSKLDQPSQNLSDHMQNEPDHVSDSLSEQSENVPTDEDLHQTQTETQNDDGLITPDPSIIVPSQAETPPVYVKPKNTKTSSISKLSKSPHKSKSKTPSRSKSISKLSFKSPSKSSSKSKSKAKSTNSSRIRRSARIQSGVGTGRKIIKDTTVHVIDDDDDVDDSEKTLSAQPADELLDDVEAVTSTKSAPTKPKSKPSPVSTKKSPTPKVSKGKEKMVFKEKGKAASDGKEQKKKAKTKFIPIPLIHPDDKENFEKYWKVKPVPAGRIFDFVELEKKGINVLKYVEPLGWTDFFKIKDSVLPQLVQAFYHNANVHEDKNLIISNIRGVEIQIDTETLGCLINLPFEGATIYGGDWYSKLGVSKEALILELFNEEGANMEEPTSSYLKKEFKIIHNMLLHCIFPRIGSKQKVTDIDLLIMYHMTKGIKLNLPYVIIQHMIHAAKSGSKKIALPYGMILTKIFRIFEIDESNQRVDNSCTVFGLKFLHHMKKETFSEESVDLGKRKREVFEKEDQIHEKDGLEMLSDALGEQTENVLQSGSSAGTNIGINTESIPSHLSTSLHFGTPFSHGFTTVPPRSGKNLETIAAFYSTTFPQNTTAFSPLMPSSSQGSLHTMFSSELMKNLAQTTPDSLKFPSTMFASESLPSLPASFATLDSFCSSTATAAAAHENVAKYLGPDLNQPGPSEMPSPAKKPKMETDMAKMFKMLTYVMMEFKIMREWIATTVCPHLNVTAPPPNPSPAIDSETSTSSDDSSPTSPK